MGEDHDGRAPPADDAKHYREMSDYNQMRDRVVARVLHLKMRAKRALTNACVEVFADVLAGTNGSSDADRPPGEALRGNAKGQACA